MREAAVRGMFARVQVGPERSEGIPDEPAVRLVIVHPQLRHAQGDMASPAAHFASMAAQGRGAAGRMNRNMVVFLAADARRYEELDDAVRQYLAWDNLAGTEDQGTRPAAAAGRPGAQRLFQPGHLTARA